MHHAKLKKALTCDSQYNESDCRWQDSLAIVRENSLVTVANIAGYLDLSLLAGDVSRMLLDGLLHWLVCRSEVADEPLSSTSISVILTPKQLVLETLVKMSVLEANVDCIMSSSDKSWLSKSFIITRNNHGPSHFRVLLFAFGHSKSRESNLKHKGLFPSFSIYSLIYYDRLNRMLFRNPLK